MYAVDEILPFLYVGFRLQQTPKELHLLLASSLLEWEAQP